MIKENWKDVIGYEGLYKVSDLRRVKSLNYRSTGEEMVLKQRKRKDGYLQVRLCKEGKVKYYKVHRLVAQAFIPNPENYPVINHKDENPSNNCINNLEWCTQKYNCNYGARNKKIAKSQSNSVMCIETNTIYISAHDAQRKTGICVAHICACARHKKRHYTAGGYHWEYV